jgi:hypothetical protein
MSQIQFQSLSFCFGLKVEGQLSILFSILSLSESSFLNVSNSGFFIKFKFKISVSIFKLNSEFLFERFE